MKCFNANEWCLNTNGDMLFNVNTFKTIRKKTWKDYEKSDGSNDFSYFSFHDLNAAQPVAFIFAQREDAVKVHKQTVDNNFTFDMVDCDMWNELNRTFLNGVERDNLNSYDSDY